MMVLLLLVQQTEIPAQFPAQAGGVIAHYLQAAALLRPAHGESGNNDLPTHPQEPGIHH